MPSRLLGRVPWQAGPHSGCRPQRGGASLSWTRRRQRRMCRHHVCLAVSPLQSGGGRAQSAYEAAARVARPRERRRSRAQTAPPGGACAGALKPGAVQQQSTLSVPPRSRPAGHILSVLCSDRHMHAMRSHAVNVSLHMHARAWHSGAAAPTMWGTDSVPSGSASVALVNNTSLTGHCHGDLPGHYLMMSTARPTRLTDWQITHSGSGSQV